jgi:CDP-glucose 4,6-dehydratase
LLAERLWEGGAKYAEAWNFGPDADDAMPVSAVIDRMALLWGDGATWIGDEGDNPHEAALLGLDAGKAHERLGWRPRWTVDDALAATVDWYRQFLAGRSPRDLSLGQIAAFEDAGRAIG